MKLNNTYRLYLCIIVMLIASGVSFFIAQVTGIYVLSFFITFPASFLLTVWYLNSKDNL